MIRSQRLTYRPFKLSDAHWMYELNKDEDVIRYTGDLAFANVNEAQNFISQYLKDQGEKYGRQVLTLKETSQIIGWSGLKLNSDKEVDLGFRLFKKYWNQGFATESAFANLKYGFETLRLEKIVGHAHVENHASLRILNKVGFSKVKIVDDIQFFEITP